MKFCANDINNNSIKNFFVFFSDGYSYYTDNGQMNLNIDDLKAIDSDQIKFEADGYKPVSFFIPDLIAINSQECIPVIFERKSNWLKYVGIGLILFSLLKMKK